MNRTDVAPPTKSKQCRTNANPTSSRVSSSIHADSLSPESHGVTLNTTHDLSNKRLRSPRYISHRRRINHNSPSTIPAKPGKNRAFPNTARCRARTTRQEPHRHPRAALPSGRTRRASRAGGRARRSRARARRTGRGSARARGARGRRCGRRGRAAGAPGARRARRDAGRACARAGAAGRHVGWARTRARPRALRRGRRGVFAGWLAGTAAVVAADCWDASRGTEQYCRPHAFMIFFVVRHQAGLSTLLRCIAGFPYATVVVMYM